TPPRFRECAPRYLGIAFANDLRQRSAVVHGSPPKDGRPPNAGTSAGRVLDLGPDDLKAVVLESRSEFGRGTGIVSLKRTLRPAYRASHRARRVGIHGPSSNLR